MSTSYTDLTNVSAFGKKREPDFEQERGEIMYYCRDCRKRVEAIPLPPQKIGKRLKEHLHECPLCHGQNIAIGTEASVRAVYERR